MENLISRYLSEIGRKGGKKSKRVLTPEQAKEMVRIREAKKSKPTTQSIKGLEHGGNKE